MSVLTRDLAIADVDPDELPALMTALIDDRDDKIFRRRTAEAEQSDHFLRLSRQRHSEVTRLRDQQAREGRIRRRYDSAVQELADLTARHAAEDRELRRLNTEKQEALKSQHDMELESMHTIWRTGEKGRFFNRTSSLLRTMRRQTVLLLNEHRYQEMRRAEVLANQQEEWETDQSHHCMTAARSRCCTRSTSTRWRCSCTRRT
jgi:hypothetical protein